MPDYNANIPQDRDPLNDSQQDLLENFQVLKTAIDVNHGTFGAADEGKHVFVTLPVDPNPTNPQPIATDLVIKCNINTFTNLPEINYQRTGANSRFPFTVRQNNLGQLASGWATLGGNNIIMKWGYGSASGFSIIGFPTGNGIPSFTAAPYNMQLITLCPPGFTTDINARLVASISPILFSVVCTQRTTNNATLVPFFWLAIGPS